MNIEEVKLKARIAEFIPFALYIVNTEFNIVYINSAFTKQTGWGKEILGENPRVISSGKMNKEYYEGLYSTITSGHTWQDIVEDKKKDGSLYFAIQKISPIFEDGNIVGYVAIQEDITNIIKKEEELEIANAKLEKAIESKDIFLASVNHELKNPLSNVYSLIQLLKMTDLNDEQKEYIERSLNMLNLGINITQNILDVISSKSNDITIMKRPTNLKTLIDGFDDKIIFNNENPNVRYKLINKLPNEDYYVDGEKITQVVYNLVRNALKYTREGNVCLRVWEDDKLYFQVEDEGIGISDDNLENIFKIFFQEKRDMAHPGLGLGLAISKKIAEKMDGDITVESQLDKGSTFTFFIEK